MANFRIVTRVLKHSKLSVFYTCTTTQQTFGLSRVYYHGAIFSVCYRCTTTEQTIGVLCYTNPWLCVIPPSPHARSPRSSVKTDLNPEV